TYAHVQSVIAELGYEASLVAQSLRNHKTNVVGILVADLEPFITEVLKGAGEGLRGTGFELVIYSAGGRTGDLDGWERRYLSRLSGTLIDGAILVTPTIVDVNYGAPIVAVDPHTGTSDTPTIDADNLRGAHLATEHLIDLGHKRIAMLTGRQDLESSVLRERGYRQAMRKAGLDIDERLIQPGEYHFDPSRDSARTMLSLPEPPTAIFAANDTSALATLAVAAELGIRVPQDLSVVGFDNIPESALNVPALTTVEQPIRLMGQRAVEMLIELIEGRTLERTHVTLDTRLVVRASTSAPATT
ncbi:LacI family DNA-binding transcriptional regulator, partial [Jatrophihabitans sp.]|uniref:LacI family DNA-binding transcriptional regulator n=1 Tax=Jatrophihabitans sp. TaxID=1932789 RepID=UPI002F1A8A1A